jgi:cadherin-like protein
LEEEGMVDSTCRGKIFVDESLQFPPLHALLVMQVTINLVPVNDAPVPLNDTYSTLEETPVILYVDVYDESSVADLTMRSVLWVAVFNTRGSLC